MLTAASSSPPPHLLFTLLCLLLGASTSLPPSFFLVRSSAPPCVLLPSSFSSSCLRLPPCPSSSFSTSFPPLFHLCSHLLRSSLLDNQLLVPFFNPLPGGHLRPLLLHVLSSAEPSCSWKAPATSSSKKASTTCFLPPHLPSRLVRSLKPSPSLPFSDA